ncbi:hypothetical protein ACNJYA_15510 [Bradyrhizobium sp. DASA03068]|uniref:hypothetical protein n=1 Tax=Bradyrhizobium sp. BLXBL-01 TaxID=3395915 RepID=UPI003F7002A6
MARNFGSSETGGFNEITKKYKADPSIENYVRLRRGDPEAEIEIGTVGGFESMFYMREVLARYGIDPKLLGGILDADQHAISEMALRLMEKLIEAQAIAADGETHLIRRGLAIPDKLIDWIICCSLDALSWNDDLMIPRDLIVLVRERLGGSNLQYEKEGQIRENKQNAGLIAGQLMAQGINPTFKIVGKALGVAPSTVKRWFGPGEFERERDVYAKWFDNDGNLRPLDQRRE